MPDSSVESSGLRPPTSRTAPHRKPFRSDGAFNIASILCLSMLFSKISRKKFPDTFEKNTSSTLLKHRPSWALSMITPVCSKSPPNQAGDIYYSTLFRFVKPVSKDFSKNLRSGRPTPRIRRNSIAFEENTGPFANRYHIKYTRFHTLSSQIRQKNRKTEKNALSIRTRTIL